MQVSINPCEVMAEVLSSLLRTNCTLSEMQSKFRILETLKGVDLPSWGQLEALRKQMGFQFKTQKTCREGHTLEDLKAKTCSLCGDELLRNVRSTTISLSLERSLQNPEFGDHLGWGPEQMIDPETVTDSCDSIWSALL